MANLPFENQLLVDSFSDDCLFIFAQGLGLERTFLNHLKLYSDPKVLVLVLNTSNSDEQYFAEKLQLFEDVDSRPKFITSDISINDRKALYLTGGVQFVTSRILVVDLLMDRIPAHLISGIVVYKAHQLLRSFQESFILRLYRQKKKDGFVKAFTDSPTLIGDGNIGQLQRLVRSLYVKKVHLVPRFEAEVKQQLHERAPEVIEMSVELSPPMKRIQNSLLEIIGTCVKELKQCNLGLMSKEELGEEEDDALGVKAALSLASFYDSPIERKLSSEDCYDQLSDKSKKLLEDLKFLRLLLKQMEQLDPATFWNTLATFKSDQKEFTRNSGWLFTSAASTLFSEAEKRIKLGDKKPTKNKVPKERPHELETPPKWDALKAVIEEIRETYTELKKDLPELKSGSVMLVVDNSECGKQLRDVLKYGSDPLLVHLDANKVRSGSRSDADKAQGPSSSPYVKAWWDPNQIVTEWRERSHESKSTPFDECAAVDKMKREQMKHLREKKGLGAGQKTLEEFTPVKRPKLMDLNEEREDQSIVGSPQKSDCDDKEDPLLLIHSLDSSRYQFLRALEMVDPTFVILYHTNLATIRFLELHKARRVTGVPLRIYSIQYKDSAEEQRYLGAISRESRTFHFLIQEKGSLLIPREYDTVRDSGVLKSEKLSSRKAGGQAAVENEEERRSVVVIDMREFRSELPLLLYKRGIDIAPMTLEVGDYILTPETCVERKSLADLAGSLAKGRLYSQAEKMLRHYQRVIVLIEGEGSRGSSREPRKKKPWSNKNAFSGDMGPSSRALRAKLALLTRKFPDLSLIWTPGPQASVDIIEELKFDKPEPDPEVAASIRWDVKTKASSDLDATIVSKLRKYNPIQRAMLLALPGVTEKNVGQIMEQGSSFLSMMSSETLEDIHLGSEIKNKWLEIWENKFY